MVIFMILFSKNIKTKEVKLWVKNVKVKIRNFGNL